jgi:hypothetical protein
MHPDDDPPRHRSPDHVTRGELATVLPEALDEFRSILGHTPERISGVRRTDDGWSILADVVELDRIPSTTSVLATYRIDVDAHGGLVGYERLRRFVRGATD